MSSSKNNYEMLLENIKELIIVGSAGSILHWDMETKMPPRGVELKSQQLAFIQKTAHQILTSPKVGKLLDTVELRQNFMDLTM